MFRSVLLLIFIIISLGYCKLPGKNVNIIGGFKAHIGDIPFQVMYLVGNVYQCGGVIISPAVVMTAAHCIKPHYKKSSIFAGALSISRHYRRSQRRSVIRTLIHEDYIDEIDNANNDIALLFLKRPLIFDSHVQAAVLPSKDEDYQNSTINATVSGWGADNDNRGGLARYLKFTNVNLIPRDICIKEGGPIGNNVLCAGSVNSTRDACQGDSGGPLFINNNKVIGLVSFGWLCAIQPGPGAYTDISRLREWIFQNSGI